MNEQIAKELAAIILSVVVLVSYITWRCLKAKP